MYYITEIACVFAEMWMIHVFLAADGKKAKRTWWQFALPYTVFVAILTALSFVPNAAFVRGGFCLLSIWGFAIFFFGNGIIRGLLSSLIFCTLVALVDIFCSLIMMWAGVDAALMVAYGIPRAVYLIFTHILLLAVIMLVCLIRRKGDEAISVKILIPVFPCWLATFLLCCLLSWQVLMLGERIHWAYIGAILGLMYTNIVMIYYINRMNRQAWLQQEMELAEHHYAMQQEYYDQFRVQQEETRAIWHDISKFLRAAQADGTNQSWEQIQKMLDDVSCVVDVNNRIVSIILNEYVQAAKTAGVELVLDVQVPPELFVTAADLYVLIGNTIDNALEACDELPAERRRILLKLKTHNNILFYEIENPDVSQAHKLRNKFHGYGLKNARRCVERYNGNLEVIRQDGTFRVRAHLNSM